MLVKFFSNLPRVGVCAPRRERTFFLLQMDPEENPAKPFDEHCLMQRVEISRTYCSDVGECEPVRVLSFSKWHYSHSAEEDTYVRYIRLFARLTSELHRIRNDLLETGSWYSRCPRHFPAGDVTTFETGNTLRSPLYDLPEFRPATLSSAESRTCNESMNSSAVITDWYNDIFLLIWCIRLHGGWTKRAISRRNDEEGGGGSRSSRCIKSKFPLELN